MDGAISELIKNIEDQFIGFFRVFLFLNQLIDILISTEFFLAALTLLEEDHVVVLLEVIGILLEFAEVIGGHFDFFLTGDPGVLNVFFESSRQFWGLHQLLKVVKRHEFTFGVVKEVSCHIEETNKVLDCQGRGRTVRIEQVNHLSGEPFGELIFLDCADQLIGTHFFGKVNFEL